jgi:hypothetical protein
MKKLFVRLPDDLHSALCSLAGQQSRSLNNLLVYLLQQSVERQTHATPSDFGTPASAARDRDREF